MKWKIDAQSNDELQQTFIDRTVQQAEVMAHFRSRCYLKWNRETGTAEWGTIDWTEFQQRGGTADAATRTVWSHAPGA